MMSMQITLLRHVAAGAAGILAAFALFPHTTQAGDVEYVGQGTRALGRGGAFAARADDPMAMAYNPAALADLPDFQLMLNANNAFYDACVTREGTYGDQVDPQINGTTDRFGDFITYRNQPFPRVCQHNRLNPGLWLAATMRPADNIGVGFGVLTPASAAHLIWGDGKGGTKKGTEPSPVRYQLVEQDIKLILPTASIGVRAAPWLRLGLSLQWGIALIKNLNYTVLNGTENPNEDTRSELHVDDLFIPAAIFSLHVVPRDALDIVFHGRISDDIRATGEVEVRVGDFNRTPVATSKNDQVSLQAAQPSQFGLSLRYADRLRPREEGQRGDAMRDERWDLELDAVYIVASQFKAISVDIPTLPLVLEDGLRFDLPHEWKDQISLRLGGDFNAIPGVLAVRAGVHYESTALDGSYMGIDFQPAQRLGLHAGLTYRVGSTDLSLGYAHIFQETVTLPRNAAAYRQVADENPLVVNAGTYASSFDVVSFGVTHRFEGTRSH
jgi:long-chain fatty acid transport protein